MFQDPLVLAADQRAYLTISGESPGFDELQTVLATAHGPIVATYDQVGRMFYVRVSHQL